MANKISEFVEGIRLEESSRHRCLPHDGREEVQPGQPCVTPSKGDKEGADKVILQAEQFKANITAPPKGNEFTPILVENDDDFFHITCHVEHNLKEKIERGDFVDLEKLLPKERCSSDEKRMELVSRNGMTYFAPVQDRAARITGL